LPVVFRRQEIGLPAAAHPRDVDREVLAADVRTLVEALAGAGLVEAA
jgi:hypothetical protein